MWVLADTALGSLTNAGLTIGLARVVSAGEYGAFALSFTIFALVQSVSKAVNNEVIVIAYAGRDPHEQKRAALLAASGAVSVGAVSGAVAFFAGVLTGGSVGLCLMAMGLCLPALMFQDHWRSTFIAFGRPRNAFFLDLLWAVLWASAFAVLIQYGVRTAALFVMVWGGAALVAGLWGAAVERTGLAWRGTLDWFRTHREISVPSMANTFATLGSLQIAFLLISVLGSVEDLGALRGAQTLLGPLNIVGFALLSFAVPELVRAQLGRRALMGAALAMSGVLLVVTIVWGAILLSLPPAIGRELLGDTWAGARETLPGLVLYLCLSNCTIGAAALMRSLNRVKSVLMITSVLGPLIIVCALAGVLLAGAPGAAFGFAVAGGLMVVPWWWAAARDAGRGPRALGDD